MNDRIIIAFHARDGFECQPEPGDGDGYFVTQHTGIGVSTLWIPAGHADAVAEHVEQYDGDETELIVSCAILIRQRSDRHCDAR